MVLSSTAATKTKPTQSLFLYRTTADVTTSAAITIPAASFAGTNGSAVTSLQTIAEDNGYYQMFISGQLQQTALYTVSDSQLVIRATSPSQTIPYSSAITLVTTNFAPSTAVTMNS